MKKILSMLLVLLFLSACSLEPEPIGEFVAIEVTDKRVEEECGRGCWNEYYVSFEKDGTKIELEANSESQFNVLAKGNIVDVTYYDDYSIAEIKLPALEGDTKNETTE